MRLPARPVIPSQIDRRGGASVLPRVEVGSTRSGLAPAGAVDDTPAVAATFLLPPSEGKASGGRGRWRPGGGTFRRLGAQRQAVAEALAGAMADEVLAGRLLGVKGPALEAARRANLRTVGSPTLPAAERYRGVVWEHLAPAELTDAARQRAEDGVVVLSGLLGAARLSDPVPDYKLKMGASLPGIGPVAGAWRAAVTEAVRLRARRAPVFDLLPLEHARAIDLGGLGASEVVRVEFRSKGGKAVGHDAKAVKGTLARHLLEADDPLDAADGFRWRSWRATVSRPDPGQLLISVITD